MLGIAPAKVQAAWSGWRRVAMNAVTDAVPVNSPVSRTTPSQRFFEICYYTAIIVATIGWVSAFGWITVRVAEWLFA